MRPWVAAVAAGVATVVVLVTLMDMAGDYATDAMATISTAAFVASRSLGRVASTTATETTEET